MALVGGLLIAAQLAVGAAPIVDRVIEEAIRRGVFPGAVVLLGTGNRILIAKGYGHFTWSASSAVPDPDSTLFDLASLTKVVATTPAIMQLVAAGDVDLDRPVRDYLPDFTGPSKERVTVRHLLQHRSGLRAFLPLNQLTTTAEEARRRVLEEPLRWAPGSRVEYSDLNAIMLGWIVDRASGMSLERYATDHVFRPLGMDQTRFNPPRSLRPRIAPVGLWRGHAIAGEVHDQNAARLGNVAGHAGLYSTAADLARYAQALLRGGRGGHHQVFSPTTLQEFTRRGPGNRALGWEVNDTTTLDNTGRFLGPDAYGHGGFTGTSIWIDPNRGLFVIVLTNRVYAPRARRSISALKRVRAEVADAAVALHDATCRTAGTPGAACE